MIKLAQSNILYDSGYSLVLIGLLVHVPDAIDPAG
jgi:hypothetical protein